MSEKIGGVLLRDEDYPGRDLYSDGAVEDELLAIAKTEKPCDFDRIVAERKSWPVMYHFSSVRQNILNWYPIRETDRVLEIGSGCGAITSSLAERAAHVTCVDLSKKRSLVNAYRNREYDNIEILLGNFEDVEKRLPHDFDVITLIGVFEYGSSYIHSEKPYEEFLRIVSSHLNPDGRLLIAIENRLGLKYFAGCREDHSGLYFDGIENYPETDYAHTFSKPQLERMLQETGLSSYQFYYPYPDYKFPLSVYSDTYLPKKGELRNNAVNYDRSRMILFDEGKAWDSLVEDGLFPLFSNSYFIEAREDKR
ncbi:MAG: class I SAM-dependent methyltransferase [Lachnospiraceae bacterium]|nr:class I SAM-dependent methyltransferase [Lachnospiraceae bacterium]